MSLAAWMISASGYHDVSRESLLNAQHVADLKAARSGSASGFDLGRTIAALRRRFGGDESRIAADCCAA